MSYNLFLLLNPNHDREKLLQFLAGKLEQTGPTSFCFDLSPDRFYAAEYLEEGQDTSILIDIPFGAENETIRDVLDFMTALQDQIQYQVLDPQVGKILQSEHAKEILDAWVRANREALANYSDGHFFLRNVEARDGKKVMIEAIRFQEETWQNHCSVAMAYNRIRDARSAATHLLRARELAPDNVAVWHALGVTLFNLQRYSEAEEILRNYLAADSENETARELVAICQSKTKTS